MIQKIFSVRDAKAEVFHQPFYATTHAEAERNFNSLTNDEKSFVNKYPEDYDLYYLGEYDDHKGTFKTLDTPLHVVKAIQLVRNHQQPVLKNFPVNDELPKQ